MFQTSIILFLQSAASDFITCFMNMVTRLGDEPSHVVIIGLILFGVNFRKGFLLFQLILWSAVLNDILKDLFALPRPVYIDSAIRHLVTGEPNTSPFNSMGAKGFFELLPLEIIEYFRPLIQNGWGSYGFPSGHVQSTATMWGGISILFKDRVIRHITPVVIILMAISRMYLGRHFLADVLGGAVIAGIILLIFHHFHARCSLEDVQNPILFIIPLLLLPFYPHKSGILIGANAGFLLVLSSGVPCDPVTLPNRAFRVLSGFIIFYATSLVLDSGIEFAGMNADNILVQFLEKALPCFMIIWGTVTINTKFGIIIPETGKIE